MMLVPRTSGKLDLLVLRHLQISASLYSFFCTRSVGEGVAILATVIVNYGTKIRSNQEIFLPFFLVRSKYLKLKKSAEEL